MAWMRTPEVDPVPSERVQAATTDQPWHPEDAHDAHSLGVLSVLPGSRVLDVGCAAGDVARRLTERGCIVTGVEIDPDTARSAERWCERVLLGDVEAMDLPRALGDAPFDAIVALDVLEHLKDPAKVVRSLVSLLAADGRFIASIPNVTHAAVRLQLLDGRFSTTEEGLLDRTHLHFFDRAEAEALLEDNGLVVVERLRTRRAATETEIEVDLGSVPPAVLDAIRADPDAETYQFVLVASPGHGEGGPVRSLAAVLQSRLEGAVDQVREGATYARHLEERLHELEAERMDVEAELASTRLRFEAVEARASEVERALRERLAELDVLHSELRHLQADLELKDSYVLELRAALVAARSRAAELDPLERELGRVHAQCKIEFDRRTEVEAELAAVTGRAGYRLITRIERALTHHRVTNRIVRGLTRYLAR
jgi:2-polyprenyl-3-methyl-5-hydroxy-6-metoxy-1,4-benzoquinol methylase